MDNQDSAEYKSLINHADFLIKQMRDERKTPTIDSRREQIKIHIHTLLVMKWLAAKHFGVDSTSISNKLKKYYCAVHIKILDELYLLRNYKYGGEDVEKFLTSFKEETKYEVQKI